LFTHDECVAGDCVRRLWQGRGGRQKKSHGREKHGGKPHGERGAGVVGFACCPVIFDRDTRRSDGLSREELGLVPATSFDESIRLTMQAACE